MRNLETEPKPSSNNYLDSPDAWDHVNALGVDDSPQAFNAVYAALGIKKLYPGTSSVAPNQRQSEAANRTIKELSERGLILDGKDI